MRPGRPFTAIGNYDPRSSARPTTITISETTTTYSAASGPGGTRGDGSSADRSETGGNGGSGGGGFGNSRRLAQRAEATCRRH